MLPPSGQDRVISNWRGGAVSGQWPTGSQPPAIRPPTSRDVQCIQVVKIVFDIGLGFN
jgi:hypothetical protein